MFAVDGINRAHATHGNSDWSSSTSLGSSNRGNKTKRLKVTKPKYGKVPQHTHPNDIQPIDLNLAYIVNKMSHVLREDLQQTCQHEITFT